MLCETRHGHGSSRYAMSGCGHGYCCLVLHGIDLVCASTRSVKRAYIRWEVTCPIVLRICYAMSGTDA
eukprot:2512403-Rhodomonas_salina.2